MRYKLTLLTLVLITAVLFAWSGEIAAQATATPARINLATPTAPPTLQLMTETPTRTPTPVGMVVLEAITEANVRAEPDPESERLGTIRSGEIYTVLGRYFRWIQFQYDPSPNGRGWVFDELVTITGDQSAIPDLAAQDLPTVDLALLGATQTLEIMTLTPGGILTATANARLIPAPGATANAVLAESTDIVESSVALPTFTYPPDIQTPNPNRFARVEATPIPEGLVTEIDRGAPPIIPILALGGLGLLGLLISSMRR